MPEPLDLTGDLPDVVTLEQLGVEEQLGPETEGVELYAAEDSAETPEGVV